MKLKTIAIILILVAVGYWTFSFFVVPIQLVDDVDGKYQGPVPEDYDVEHFRLTGETIPLEENN